MLATRENMRKCEDSDINAVQICPVCSSQYSATSGDYFQCPDDFELKCCGHSTLLVTTKTVIEDIDI